MRKAPTPLLDRAIYVRRYTAELVAIKPTFSMAVGRLVKLPVNEKRIWRLMVEWAKFPEDIRAQAVAATAKQGKA